MYIKDAGAFMSKYSEPLHNSQFWRSLVSKTYESEKKIGHHGYFFNIDHVPLTLLMKLWYLVKLVKMGYVKKQNITLYL